MPADLVEPMLGRCAEFWNMYGPTETTVWSSCFQITDANAPILIGKPIANTQIYVLDERLQTCSNRRRRRGFTLEVPVLRWGIFIVKT